jgi:hypothetical protein
VVPRAVDVTAIPGVVRELTYDHVRDALWYLSAVDSGTDLIRFDLADGTAATARLPGLPADGSFYSHVGVAPDGSVWVASGYSVVRYQPGTSMMATKTFERQVSGALPGALDPNTPLPGTWISAITFTANSTALIARHNVPFLQTVTTSLGDGPDVAIPEAVYGTAAMALGSGGLYYRPALMAGGSSPDAIAVTPIGLAAPPDAVPLLRDTAGPSAAVLAVGVNGESAVWNQITGTLTWRASSAAAPSSLLLASGTAQIAAPNGQLRTVTTRASVIAVAFDNTGTLWYIENWQGQTHLVKTAG